MLVKECFQLLLKVCSIPRTSAFDHIQFLLDARPIPHGLVTAIVAERASKVKYFNSTSKNQQMKKILQSLYPTQS